MQLVFIEFRPYSSIIKLFLKFSFFIFKGLFLFSCASPLQILEEDSKISSIKKNDTQDTSKMIGTYLIFNEPYFYSLTNPHPETRCAGDAHTFFNPLSLGPTPFEKNFSDNTTTIRPAFLKNVYVDLTNTNANFQENLAYSCSFGSGGNSPPVSQCATFDYGDIDGVPSSLSGTFFLIGGLKDKNFSGNSLSCDLKMSNSNFLICNRKSYALGIKNEEANWVALNNSTQVPPENAGASISYSDQLKKILLFGGASFFSSEKSTKSLSSGSIYTADTWIFDLKIQKWSKIDKNVNIISELNTQKISFLNDSNESINLTFSKDVGGRSLFGYTNISGTAITEFRSSGKVYGSQSSPIDTTDRILIVGGYGDCTSLKQCYDSHSFNPTFGPEYRDTLSPADSMSTTNFTSSACQWIDSYPNEILNNQERKSWLIPVFPEPSSSPPENYVHSQVNFGLVSLNNQFPTASGSLGLGVSSLSSPIPGRVNFPGSGYLLSVGGFYGLYTVFNPVNEPNTSTCDSIQKCGGMQLGLKWFKENNWNQNNELYASNFSFVNAFKNSILNENTPIKWVSTLDQTTPWYGGGTLLKGIHLPLSSLPSPSFPSPIPSNMPSNPPPEATNQVVFFGGADCRDYLDNSAASCPYWSPLDTPAIGNPGRYWIFGIDPAHTFGSQTSTPISVPMAGVPPYNAGMAAARGLDSQNKPYIVAWGGANRPAGPDNSGKIWYLYYNTLKQKPTWASVLPVSSGPRGLINAALVFSHVTQKFYLFGGYHPSDGNSGETWELTQTNSSCASATSDQCTFSWRVLNSNTGTTCYPFCPPARRSHRMIEANYHYFNPPYEPFCSSSSQPCSFGIFMEGGTANGIDHMSSRWMFDPTANAGAGHWQTVDDIPPRALSATTILQYTPKNTETPLQRVLLFGGETGMQNPNFSQNQTPPQYFVAPTLGDTWLYDFKSDSWNRVLLYGERYHSLGNLNISETAARAASFTDDPSTQILSPPPISGGMMVTRTLSKPSHQPSEEGKLLKIPEVFFLGGRKKDGTYQLLNSVYKFCIGSPGEKPYPFSLIGTTIPLPDDASCDAYDVETNPLSQSPVSSYRGRWLLKSPQGVLGFHSSSVGSFLGAAVYDSTHDLVIVYGGLTPLSPPYETSSITQTNQRGVLRNILEYTPPSSVSSGTYSKNFNGSWEEISSCEDSPSLPVGRYGHSLGYDPVERALIVTGGYSLNGEPLTRNFIQSDGTIIHVPETWLAKRIIKDDLSVCYSWTLISPGKNHDYPDSGLTHSANIYIPSSGYLSGTYTTIDQACTQSGPIASVDSNINKLMMGGISFDIDRKQLHPQENLLLNLTIFPLSTENINADGSYLNSKEMAIFKIQLIKISESGEVIRQNFQPRNLIYASEIQYPRLATDFFVIPPPYGQIRQEQILIPMKMNPNIDRIQIERYSGNAIIIDATLWRTLAP